MDENIMKYKKTLEDLKAFLQTVDNFLKIFEQFFTLTETTDFIDHGTAKSDKVLGKIILKVIEHMFGKLYKFETLLIHLPEYRFYHGPVKVNDTQGSFFYFEDISMGLVTVYDNLAEENKFMRFTGDIVPEGTFFTTQSYKQDH